jgi:RNA polymerase sigma-70 factor (ECF subfamily)
MRPPELDAEFTRLFEENYRAVRAYALRRVPAESAADVVQETFLVAWRRGADVPAEALPWLFGVARRIILREWRASSRRDALHTRVASERTAENDPPAVRDPAAPLLAAIDRLSPNDREVLALVYWEDLTAPEAATVLGCSAAALRVRLHRARKRLTRLVEVDESPAGDPAGLCLEEAL